MNAVNPVPSQAGATAEPSMEEILASIRRIIADDQSIPGHGGPAAHGMEVPVDLPMASEPPPAEEARGAATADVSPATPELPSEHGIVAAPQFVSPEGPAGLGEPLHAAEGPRIDTPPPADMAISHDPALSAPLPEPSHPEPVSPDPLPHPPVFQEPPMHESHGGGLGPGLFSAATSQSLAAAFNTLAISRLADESQELRSLAREMLRPLLKDWLDDNLPSLVETIIREEIERMARRTR